VIIIDVDFCIINLPTTVSAYERAYEMSSANFNIVTKTLSEAGLDLTLPIKYD
jgi:hypothetical protein